MKMRLHSKGFTLLELLVVITIIAVLIALALPNFLGIRQRARDSKRKAELGELRTALRLYYNDYQTYPADNSPAPMHNVIKGCGKDGTDPCPTGCGVDFAAGGTTGCDGTVYMKHFPSDFGSSWPMYYYRQASGDDFCLKDQLENKGDSEIAVSWARCATACTFGGVLYLSGTDYAVCSD